MKKEIVLDISELKKDTAVSLRISSIVKQELFDRKLSAQAIFDNALRELFGLTVTLKELEKEKDSGNS